MIENTNHFTRLQTRYFWGLAVAWTIVVVGSLLMNINQVRQNTLEAAKIQARIAFEKDLLYRRWNSLHGGVYVPITEKTQPNSYLAGFEERDIVTPQGKQLTLMNPAYMTRQVHELQNEENDLRGHITSLDPLRPENTADEWETAALREFEKGEKEVSSIELLEGEEYLRLMRPFFTEKGCLKCHAGQGYQIGDIRGGISVAVPMKPLLEIEHDQVLILWVGHVPLWLIGLGSILWVRGRLARNEKNRLESAQVLMESEARFRAVFEQASMGVAIIRFGMGEHVRVNQRYASMLGYLADELEQKTYADIAYPNEIDANREDVRSFFAGEIHDLYVTERYYHKDGSTVWADLTGSNLRGQGDEPDQNIIFVKDITEQKKVEQALEASEAKLRSIFLAAPIGIGLVGVNRQLLWVNDKLCNMIGYSRNELEGKSARCLYPSDEEFEMAGREKYRQIDEKGSGSVETRWKRKDGVIINILLSSTPIDPDERAAGVTFAAQDISDRVQAENLLQLRAEQLELLQQASLKLTSNLDLNAVLNAILEQAMQLVTADDSHIFLYEDDVLSFGAVRWADSQRDGQFAELRQNGLTYSVARSGKSIVVFDMSDHPLYEDWPLEGAIIGLPLKMGDQVVGVMNVALDNPYEFTQEELRILELLADQAATGIANARLHEQVQDYAQNLENRVKERTEELNKTINLMAGREVRMAELKKVIKKLRKQLEDARITPIANDPLEEPFLDR